MSWYNLSERYQALFKIDYQGPSVLLQSMDNKDPFPSIIEEDGKAYRTLRVPKTNLSLSSPITIPKESTWILVCKVYGEKGSLAAGPGGTANWGFEYTVDNGWKDGGIVKNREIGSPSELTRIHYVAVSQDRNNLIYKSYNSYGGFYSNSSFFSGGFGSMVSLAVIGYVGAGWEPDVDLLGYACFDKVLSESEILEVVAAIKRTSLRDPQDIQELVIQTVNPRPSYNLSMEVFNKPLKTFSTQPFYKSFLSQPLLYKYGLSAKDIKVCSILYSKTTTISDIVLEEGLPIRSKVYLYERTSGRLLKTTISGLDGTFTFYNLNPDLEYLVLSNDNKYQYSSIIKNYNN